MTSRNIELTEEEEEKLYKKRECPKRIHVNTNRIWWVLKNQYDAQNNYFLYSICPCCYREKKDFINSLINQNGKFIPILTDNLLAFNSFNFPQNNSKSSAVEFSIKNSLSDH